MMTKEEEKMMMEKLILIPLLQLSSLSLRVSVSPHDVTHTVVTHNNSPR